MYVMLTNALIVIRLRKVNTSVGNHVGAFRNGGHEPEVVIF